MKYEINGKEIDSPKLPKELKKKWVDALRSGLFTQGNGRLENADGSLCCLGVICKVAHPKIGSLRKFTTIYTEKGSLEKKLRNIPSILKGDENDNALVEKLVDFNDTKGKSFRQIADWIDRNL